MQQHPTRPLEFYVTDKNMQEDDKLEWMKQELGNDADLPTFAAKFLELFSEKVHGDMPQKLACMKLFNAYRGACYKKESDLPPAELEAFQKVWDPNAPMRCRHCPKTLPAGSSMREPYCNIKCRDANKKIRCWRFFKPEDPCPGEVVWRDSCRVCTFCGQGQEEADRVERANKKRKNDKGEVVETELDRMFRRGANGLAVFNNVFGFWPTIDEKYEPAWKKRRRS